MQSGVVQMSTASVRTWFGLVRVRSLPGRKRPSLVHIWLPFGTGRFVYGSVRFDNGLAPPVCEPILFQKYPVRFGYESARPGPTLMWLGPVQPRPVPIRRRCAFIRAWPGSVRMWPGPLRNRVRPSPP